MRQLAAEPWSAGFFMALRRLENYHSTLPRIGESDRVTLDPVRFAQSERGLRNFHSSAIDRLEPATRTSPQRLFVHAVGLLGPNGPMPEVFTEILRQRARLYNDVAALRFLDIFHHRIVSVMYRAWASGMQTVSHDRSLTAGRDTETVDRFAMYAAMLAGLPVDATRYGSALPGQVPLFFAGWMCHRTRPTEGIVAIAQSFFGVPADAEEFIGRAVSLPPDQRARLARPPVKGRSGGFTLGNSKGNGAILGNTVWTCQSSFRLKLGPMSLPAYERLLPCERGSRRVADWMRLYVGEEFDWEVQLILAKDQVPTARLGSKAGQRSLLGWSAWLPQRTCADRGDVRLHANSWRPSSSAETTSSINRRNPPFASVS